ncbi:hypothetical protein LJC18_00325 [Lachnospiraceae bacterium OttesenSCG-928-E19]|nr:hypothetical protein [Lachnospiraceae bacterium OttesenSCG-928-E19]
MNNNVKKFNQGAAAAQGKQPGGFAAGIGAVFNMAEQFKNRGINPVEFMNEPENIK